jgi:predicted dinucleotide-binding enzyme
MKIGIIGAGNMGANVARLFVKAGHEVAISNSRGPESLRDLASEIGNKAHAATVDEAATFGDLIFLAAPWRRPEALPSADLVRNKIVVDAMNPYTAEGDVFDLNGSTSSEETLKRLQGARLVKAFNTIYYRRLATEGRTNAPIEDRYAIFVAGDDEEAKAIVMKLIEQIGFAPVDTGSLHDRYTKVENSKSLAPQSTIDRSLAVKQSLSLPGQQPELPTLHKTLSPYCV